MKSNIALTISSNYRITRSTSRKIVDSSKTFNDRQVELQKEEEYGRIINLLDPSYIHSSGEINWWLKYDFD